jgi:hypothetical protein
MWRVKTRNEPRFLALLAELRVTPIADANFLCDTKMGQWHSLRGTLLVKDLAAVAAMMFAVRESECCTTAEADI